MSEEFTFEISDVNDPQSWRKLTQQFVDFAYERGYVITAEQCALPPACVGQVNDRLPVVSVRRVIK